MKKQYLALLCLILCLTVPVYHAVAQICGGLPFNFALTQDKTALTWNWQMGGPVPINQTVQIGDTSPCPPPVGVPTCNWPVVITTDQPWVSIPNSGTTSFQLNVAIQPLGLTAGVHTAHITVTQPQFKSPTVTVTVTATVTPAPFNYRITTDKSALSFAYQVGGAAPAAQIVNVGDSSPCPPPVGVPTCHWPVTVSASQPWIVVPASGTTSFPLSVTVNTTGLSVGVYTGTINLQQRQFSSPNAQILVTVTVTAAPLVQHSVLLSWTPSAGAVSYNVRRATTPITSTTPYVTVNTTPTTSAAYTDNTVASGSTYYYAVTAVSSDGLESDVSNVVPAIIPTP